MSASILFDLSIYLFSLVILSAVLRLLILGIAHVRFHWTYKERQQYEEIYKRLAADALDGPLLLSDQRDADAKSVKPKKQERQNRPQLAPVSCHLSDPFERKFA